MSKPPLHSGFAVGALSVMNHLACEGADPAACDDATAPFVRKPHLYSRLLNQRFCAAALAVTIGICPAITEPIPGITRFR